MSSPVYINVYDVTKVNSYMYWAGLGIFHSGVEVHGVEYSFGESNHDKSGVFEVEPRKCPEYKFRRSILIGTTSLDPLQVRDLIEKEHVNYLGDRYDLIMKNCNHFCEDVCNKLTGKSIPRWVNRAARIGSMFSCILSDDLASSSSEATVQKLERSTKGVTEATVQKLETEKPNLIYQ